jgi:hypothetical protein
MTLFADIAILAHPAHVTVMLQHRVVFNDAEWRARGWVGSL